MLLGWTLLVLILLFFGYATRYLDMSAVDLLITWVITTAAILFAAHKTLSTVLPGVAAGKGGRP